MHPTSPITGQFSNIALKLVDEAAVISAPEPIEINTSASKKLMALFGAGSRKPASTAKIDLSPSPKKAGLLASLKSSVKRKSA
jgi:hypothetical protein